MAQKVDVMLSSFELSPDELVKCAVGVATALSIRNPYSSLPVCVINEFDDFFGNSVNVVVERQNPKK